MPPDEPNEEEQIEELPEDQQTPFEPARPEDTSGPAIDPNARLQPIDDTHPVTDSGLQAEEIYDEGLGNAANGGQPGPSAGRASSAEPTDDDLESDFNEETDEPRR